MDCAFGTSPKIFNKPKGIFDRLGKICTGISKIQIMGCTCVKTLLDDCLTLTTIDQRQYRDTTFGRVSRKLHNRLQPLWFGLAHVNHRNHSASGIEPASQIFQPARGVYPPAQ